jgi:hypothetical protein
MSNQIQKGNIVTATSSFYNGGKQFSGVVTHATESSVSLLTKNGRSRKSFSLTDLNISNVSKGYAA